MLNFTHVSATSKGIRRFSFYIGRRCDSERVRSVMNGFQSRGRVSQSSAYGIVM